MPWARLGCAIAVLSATALASGGRASVSAGADQRDHPASSPTSATLDEPAVAVNPLNPNVVVSAANDFSGSTGVVSVNYSTDGGHTWTRTRMPGLPNARTGSDPNLAFDSKGRLFSAYVAYSLDRPVQGGVAVIRSDDGGATWPEQAVNAAPSHKEGGLCMFSDFPAVAVDARKGKDIVYVAWQAFAQSGTGCGASAFHPLRVARSTDGGHSWSKPVEVPTGAGVGFLPTLAVDPAGRVLVTFEADPVSVQTTDCPSSGFPERTVVAVSGDGGRHFHPSVVQVSCAPGTLVPVSDPVLGLALASYTGAVYRLPPNTNTVADPRTGQLTNAVGTQDPITGIQGVRISISADHGQTWNAGGTVPGGIPGENRQYPRLAVGANGHLSLVYLSQLPGGVLSTSHSSSSDRGRTWGAAKVISSQVAVDGSPFWLGFIGDYIGNAVGSDGIAHPVWTDLRNQAPLEGGQIYTRSLAI